MTNEEIAAQQIAQQLHEPPPPKIVVVVYRRRDSDPFEARVLQEHKLGPNLSPKTGTAEMARSASERRLRAEGWHGAIEFQEGLPDDVRVLPPVIDPIRARRGLRRAKQNQPTNGLFTD